MEQSYSDEGQNQQELQNEPHNKKKILLFIVLAVSGLFLFAVFYFLNKNEYQADSSSHSYNVDSSVVNDLLSPTPMPFHELTVTYLRERTYISTLGDLEQVSENQDYTAYVTSYDSDGLKIYGLLTRPKGEVPRGGFPAIVFVHGYIPPAQYRTTQNYADYVDYLARNGFVVFKIDLRGHGNSDGEPGGAYYSSDYIIDTLNAHAALSSSVFVNSNAIGFWGHSMAGNVVMRSMAAKPDIKAVVIWAGAVYSYEDWQEYGISDGSYQRPSSDTERQRRRQELFDTHGEFRQDSPFWMQVAATNYLHDLKGAVQLHHAVNDDVVDISYSRNLKELLVSASAMHELHEYQNGGHNLTGASFNQAMQRTVEFYRKHLAAN